MPSLLCDLGVAARVVQDGKILLVQEASGTYQGKWGLPKGHVDPGESPEAAALRARGRRRRVRVGVEGQDVATDLALDAAQGPAGGGPVGVDHELLAVRAGERGAVADDVAAHSRLRRFILRGHLHGRHGGRAQSRRRLL